MLNHLLASPYLLLVEAIYAMLFLSGPLNSIIGIMGWTLPLSLGIISASLLIVAALWELISKAARLSLHPNMLTALILMLLLSGWCFLSLIFTISPTYSREKFLALLLCVIAMGYPTLNNRLRPEGVIIWHTLIIFPLAIYYTQQFFSLYLTSNNAQFAEFKSTYLTVSEHLGFSTLALIVTPTLISCRFIRLLMIFGGYALILLLGGRGALLALIGCHALFVCFQLGSRQWQISARQLLSSILLLAFSVSLLTLGYFFFSEQVSELLNRSVVRFEQLLGFVDSEQDLGSSSLSRLEMYQTSLSSWSTNIRTILIGNGLGSFGVLHFQEDVRAYSHNIFLELLVEVGLIGCGLFVALLVYILNLKPNNIFLSRWLLAFLLLNAMKSHSFAEFKLLFGAFAMYLLGSPVLKTNVRPIGSRRFYTTPYYSTNSVIMLALIVSALVSTPIYWAAADPLPELIGPQVVAQSLGNLPLGLNGTNTSIRFKAEHSGKLLGFKTFWQYSDRPNYHAGTGGKIRVRLETNQRGTPSGISLGELFFKPKLSLTNPLSKRLFFRFNAFSSPPLIQSGQTYHLTLENLDPRPNQNFISLNALYHGSGDYRYFAPSVERRSWAILRQKNSGPWEIEQFHFPILALYYDTNGDGLTDATQGHGYAEVWLKEASKIGISALSRVRQRLAVREEKTIKSLFIYLKRARGKAPLRLRLVDLTNQRTVLEFLTNIRQAKNPRRIPHCHLKKLRGRCHSKFQIPLPTSVSLQPMTNYALELSTGSNTLYELNLMRDGSYLNPNFPTNTTFAGVAEVFDSNSQTWRGWTAWGVPNRYDGDLPLYFEVYPHLLNQHHTAALQHEDEPRFRDPTQR